MKKFLLSVSLFSISCLFLFASSDNGSNVTKVSQIDPVWQAVFLNDAFRLNELLEKGYNLGIFRTKIDHSKETPLHFAAERDYRVLSKILISSDINIDEKDSHGETALYKACERGFNQLVLMLKEAGADLNIPNENNDFPLHRICLHKNLYLLKKFVEAGAKLNRKNNYGCHSLFYLFSGSIDFYNGLNDEIENLIYLISDILLQNGIDVNAQNNAGDSVLHYVAKNHYGIRNSFLADLLINHLKIDAKIKNKNKDTALHCFFTHGKHYHKFNKFFTIKDLQTVQFFLNADSEVNSANNQGNTPLHLLLSAPTPSNVISKIQLDIVKLIIERGFNIEKINQNGDTILHLSCQNSPIFRIKNYAKTFQCIQYLIQHAKADVNASNHQKNTPLHFVCNNNGIYNPLIVKILISSGAHIESKNLKGNTPLHLLCQKESLKKEPLDFLNSSFINRPKMESIQCLLQAGASPNSQNEKGETPIHLLFQNIFSSPPSPITDNQVTILKYLLQAGADVNIKNKNNHSVFDDLYQFQQSLNENKEKTDMNDDNFLSVINILIDAGAKAKLP